VVGLSHYRGIAREPGGPQPIADEKDPILVVGHREPAKLRLRPERGKSVVGRKRHLDPLGAIVCAQGRSSSAEQEDAFDELRALLVVHVELGSEAETLRQVRARRGAFDHHETARIGIRQGPQQHRVDDAEHPDHGPDGERERGNTGDQERRRAHERTPRMTEIGQPLHHEVGPRGTGRFDGI
jgi:hypothetical protein